MSRKLSRTAVQGTVGTFAVVALGAAFAYGGTFAPITGNQDPIASAEVPASDVKPIDESLAERGLALFREIGCRNCHQIDGNGEGIDLTDVHKKQPNPEWYIRFIKNPSSINPSSTMPAFDELTIEELSALAEFLRKPRGEVPTGSR